MRRDIPCRWKQLPHLGHLLNATRKVTKIKMTTQMPNTVPMALLVGEILQVINKAGMYTSIVAKKYLRRLLVFCRTVTYVTWSTGLLSIHSHLRFLWIFMAFYLFTFRKRKYQIEKTDSPSAINRRQGITILMRSSTSNLQIPGKNEGKMHIKIILTPQKRVVIEPTI